MTHPSVAIAAIAARPRRGLWATLAGFAALRRQRLALAALDDARLRDVGLTRAEAMEEAARPFWNAPDHWLR